MVRSIREVQHHSRRLDRLNGWNAKVVTAPV
jgi:hypothetical protein